MWRSSGHAHLLFLELPFRHVQILWLGILQAHFINWQIFISISPLSYGSFRGAPIFAFKLFRILYYLRSLHQCIRNLLLNWVYLIHLLGYPFLSDVILGCNLLSGHRFGLAGWETFVLGIRLILFDQYVVAGVMGHSLLFNILELDDFWFFKYIRIFSPFLTLSTLESLFGNAEALKLVSSFVSRIFQCSQNVLWIHGFLLKSLSTFYTAFWYRLGPLHFKVLRCWFLIGYFELYVILESWLPRLRFLQDFIELLFANFGQWTSFFEILYFDDLLLIVSLSRRLNDLLFRVPHLLLDELVFHQRLPGLVR